MGWIRASLVVAVVAIAVPVFSAERWYAIDGDTIVAPDKTKVRVLGVDTPELHPCRCEYECRLGNLAKRRTQRALDEGPVLISPFRPDRYGRMLARVFIGGRDLSLILIEEGLGRPYQGEQRQSWCGGTQ